jgi:hypothetical protein
MRCPHCAEEMVAYVSVPIDKHPTERRIYFSCRCGQLAARNESEPDIATEPTPLASGATA